MKLRELLAQVEGVNQLPDNLAMDREVLGLSTNSHACQPEDLFIGMPGTRVDGGEFWQSAIAFLICLTVNEYSAQLIR